MYSLKYGTLPIVRETGGLDQTPGRPNACGGRRHFDEGRGGGAGPGSRTMLCRAGADLRGDAAAARGVVAAVLGPARGCICRSPTSNGDHYLARYFYGAASRRGAPPMPLQGVWTADNGGLPPWKGDYHNDLNTQMTYIAYPVAGNFDEGACFLDYLFELLPVFRKFAGDFYEAPGAAVPGVMSLAGQPLGGWGQYSLSPTMGAWNAHLFYLHWRYTADDEFLRQRAYPFCREIGECERALLKPDTNGVLKLFRSSSPEIFDNSPRAWLVPNSNYDLACLKMLFLALSEMAEALGKDGEATSWAATAAALGDFHTDANGLLLVDARTPLPYSHRHLSNIIGLYPFNLITREGGDQDRQRIRASLAQWDKLGTSAWCGYSWSWMRLSARPRRRCRDRRARPRCVCPRLHLAQWFPCQRRPDAWRFLEHDLPPIHARRQFPGDAGRPRNAASKLEPHPRPARHRHRPHLSGGPVALA